MPDRFRFPDTDGNADREPTSGIPRWIVVLGVCAAIVLLVLIAGLHLTGVVGPK
jgi:hypothetical protein